MQTFQSTCGKAGAQSRLTYAQAVALQERLKSSLVGRAPRRRVRNVGGADVGFAKDGRLAIGGIVVLAWPSLELVDVSLAVSKAVFPYIPGLLSFREVPVLVDAYRRLSVAPDVIFCDGQGLAHPRRFGLACHLGVVLRLPTIGCAKSILVGRHGLLDSRRGSTSPLVDSGEVVGLAVRTRDNVRPVYVSRGHMMDLDTARDMVVAATRGYRLPEPARLAHQMVKNARSFRRTG